MQEPPKDSERSSRSALGADLSVATVEITKATKEKQGRQLSTCTGARSEPGSLSPFEALIAVRA